VRVEAVYSRLAMATSTDPALSRRDPRPRRARFYPLGESNSARFAPLAERGRSGFIPDYFGGCVMKTAILDLLLPKPDRPRPFDTALVRMNFDFYYGAVAAAAWVLLAVFHRHFFTT
jgi:hypothetical protein